MTAVHRSSPRWLNVTLGVVVAALVFVAILLVGPPSQSAQQGRAITATQGVVQATVSGAGNVQPASELDLGFQTGGVVTHIYVHEGDYVTEGGLLAELDPQAAEVTLGQARASLQAAEATLSQAQEAKGEPSSATQTQAQGAKSEPSSAKGSAGARTTAPNKGSSTTPASTTSTISQATREANIVSAGAAVRSDRLTVEGDEQALADTKLYAPQTGTIVSLAGEVGETVSARGTTKATASSGSSASGGSSSATGSSSRSGASSSGGASSSSGGASSAASSSSTGSSGSAFAVLSDLSSMQLVVALSESEIASVKIGQTATVTIEALEGRKLAAHVVSVATLPTSSSGVVSYDVTFQLDQEASGLKPGMSATAEVVVKQAEGVNVPTSAISGGAVTVLRNGKQVSQSVVTGLAGASSTIVLSGVRAGEKVVLPIARSTSSASGSGRLGGRPGGFGAGGVGGGLAGGGGAAVFRGGG